MLPLIENERPETPLWMEHEVDLPACCPVTGNPRPGSIVKIRYRPAGWLLEVFGLRTYIRSFVGGREGVRNMETMLQEIALECAAAVGVVVTVRAELVLAPAQRLKLVCRAKP